MLVAPSIFFVIMIPQLIAKYVFGMEDFLYFNDPEANVLVVDITSPSGAAFETSTKHRIVEFYSPYCVCICLLLLSMLFLPALFLTYFISFSGKGSLR
jgi:hypothetical protein